MAYREIKTTTEPLTRELTRKFAVNLAWVGERPLSPAHVRWLRNEFDEGRFYAPSWAKAWLHGDLYRVNGQHSSHMLNELNGVFPENLQVHVSEFQCDEQSDLIQLFSTFDSRSSSRNVVDIVRVAEASRPEFCTDGKFHADAPMPKIVNKLVTGIALYLDDGSQGKMTPRGRSMLINEDPQFIATACPYVTGCLASIGVCAALYHTWKANREAWPAFWDAVLTETDPDPQSPTRVLVRVLQTEKRSRSKADVRAVYVKCLHAWNAFRTGKLTKLYYRPSAPIPAVRS